MADNSEILSNYTFLAKKLDGGRWDVDPKTGIYVGYFQVTDHTEDEIDHLLSLDTTLAQQGIVISPPRFGDKIIITISPAALEALRAQSASATPQMQSPVNHQFAAIVWDQDADVCKTFVEDPDIADIVKDALTASGLNPSVSMDDSGVYFTVQGRTAQQLGTLTESIKLQK